MKKHLAVLASAILLMFNAHAQTSYPTKPVKLMVGAGAGGGSRWWWTEVASAGTNATWSPGV